MLQMPNGNARIKLALFKSSNEIKQTSVKPNGDLEAACVCVCVFAGVCVSVVYPRD